MVPTGTVTLLGTVLALDLGCQAGVWLSDLAPQVAVSLPAPPGMQSFSLAEASTQVPGLYRGGVLASTARVLKYTEEEMPRASLRDVHITRKCVLSAEPLHFESLVEVWGDVNKIKCHLQTGSSSVTPSSPVRVVLCNLVLPGVGPMQRLLLVE